MPIGKIPELQEAAQVNRDSPGSMPELGSSSKIADGLPTRAIPRASLRLLPPLYVPAGRRAMAGGMDTRLMTLHTSCLTTLASMPCTTADRFLYLMTTCSSPAWVLHSSFQRLFFHHKSTVANYQRPDYHKTCCMCPASEMILQDCWVTFNTSWSDLHSGEC